MHKISEQAKQLRQLWGGFQSSRVLLTANNFRVFDYLEKYQSSGSLAKTLHTDDRATEILLDALTGVGLLIKRKNKYRNSATASYFLVSGSPHYQGDIIRHVDSLWDNWSGLDSVLKTGLPNRRSRKHTDFIRGMHNLAVLKAKKIIRTINIKGVKTALDLGGGPGTYAMEMAGQGVHVVLFDVPDTMKIAKGLIREKGIKNIDVVPGDFINDDIGGGYDLVFISQILHSYSPADNMKILRKCRKALNKDGRIVVQEFFIEEDRTQPSHSALFSVNMLVNNKGGRCYSPVEISQWLLKAGFRRPAKKMVSDGVLVMAVK
ncbi:MAG TPA: methyltransferase domain-containing protein [Nitrospirae bacterium]|nr:methyltransferase domain-containing protein [Nitrospirota bacterium]